MRSLAGLLAVGVLAACGGDGGGAAGGSPTAVTSATISYGDAPQQFGVLMVPPGDGSHPVVVLIHGGFWRNSFDLGLADPQAVDAVAAGYAVWNVEYRRVGDDGGGYPGTLLDIAAAVDHVARLADEHALDVDRVAVVGHSAGGHLALWVGQRSLLPPVAPGAEPVVVPQLVVGQAPVADLGNALDLGGGAVAAFMGGDPAGLPDEYAVADPARLLPIDVPQLIVHGADDGIVPVDRTLAYQALADDPDNLEVLVFAGADHFAVIDPTHESWTAVKSRLP